MEEELNYAAVVFKNDCRPPKENNEDSTIYSTVATKVPATTVTTGGAAAGGAAAGGAAAGGAAAGGAAAGGAAAAHSRYFLLLLVCLGILCVLLIACIIIIIYIQEANAEKITHLEKENQQLTMEREILENNTKELSRDSEDLNRTLEVIMTFQNFPVNEFCPDKKCQPCRKSWIPFQDHCYMFYESPSYWMTWTQAQRYCQNSDGDLVVYDSLQEQEFIKNHTKFYYDKYHGYWIGLRQNDENDWIWINGRNETEGDWMQENLAGQCAMIIPVAAASWNPASCTMRNKLICEHEALIRTL